MRVAVVQHRIRAHVRMDLAALLSACEDAADEGADVIALPHLPGVIDTAGLTSAFAQNVRERAPQLSLLTPFAGSDTRGSVQAVTTRLGRTAVTIGDDCIDPALFPRIGELGLDALVWQLETESSAQAEAVVELALDASPSLAGLILAVCTVGEARGLRSFGGSVIVHNGEILAGAGGGEDLLLAEAEVPLRASDRRGQRVIPGPVLAQRLEAHRSAQSGPVPYRADLGGETTWDTQR